MSDATKCGKNVPIRLEDAALRVAFMEHSIDGIVIMDADTAGVVDANSAFAEMLGYSLDEVRRLHVWDWEVNWTREQLESMFAARDWPGERFETRHRRKDGRILDVAISITPVPSPGRAINFCVVKDISEAKSQQRKLQEELKRWQLLMEESNDGIVIIDKEDIAVVDLNPIFAGMLGYAREEMIGMHPWDWDIEYSRDEIVTSKVGGGGESGSFDRLFETRMRRKDGTELEVEVSSTSMVMNGRMQIFCFCRDITARKRAGRLLRAREQEFRSLAENAPDAIVRYDRQLRRLYVNPALVRLLGRDKSELLGQPLQNAGPSDLTEYENAIDAAFRTGNRQEVKTRYLLPGGAVGWFHARMEPEFGEDGSVKSVLAIIRDISELVEQRELAQQLALTDTLTGLPNRAHFEKCFRDAAARSCSSGCPFALLMLDLDHFKDVNDSLGHGFGDELLRQVTARLSLCVGECDTIARMGGDEFAILQSHIHNIEEATEVAGRMLNELSRPFFVARRELFISASIGIAFYPRDSSELDELFAFADTAMYSAKRQGRNNFQFYSQELTHHAAERLSLGAALRYACANRELELAYQPKVLLENGRVLGVEALLRWRHPELGVLAPDRFISIAEDTGLIIEIGRWVLKTACRAAVLFNRDADSAFKVAVNLSSRQFVRHDLAVEVGSILASTGCRGEWLEFEITESLMIEDNLEVRKTLQALRALGISIALDDFGTGYSALNYLTRFPVDVLKIDRSFVDGIDDDRRKAGLVQAFISLGRTLGMEIVAEGVETSAQSSMLQRLGCNLGQGYLFGRPQPFRVSMATLTTEQRMGANMAGHGRKSIRPTDAL